MSDAFFGSSEGLNLLDLIEVEGHLSDGEGSRSPDSVDLTDALRGFSIEESTDDRASMDAEYVQVKYESPSPVMLPDSGNIMIGNSGVAASGSMFTDLNMEDPLLSPGTSQNVHYYSDCCASMSNVPTSPVSAASSTCGTMVGLCSSTTVSPPTDQAPKRLCLICGDVASGCHYGVASCEACKAFFKRTVQGEWQSSIEYQCPANGDCEMTKRRRKSCQACRLNKCLQVGMMKEGVRLDRVRGGRQKYRRSLDYDTPTMMLHSPPKRQCLDSRGESLVLSELLEIEPEKLSALPEQVETPVELRFPITLADLADRELVVTIGWAKQVPGFNNLPISDQMNLLQAAWTDTLCLNLAFRSMPYNGTLVYADNFQINEDDAQKYSCPHELDKMCRRLVKKMTSLGVTKEEYVLLKAFNLFKEDVGVESISAVKQLQDKYHDTMIDEVSRRDGGSTRRVGHLLMILPTLAQANILTKQYWTSVKRQDKVPMHKLFFEMLEEHE